MDVDLSTDLNALMPLVAPLVAGTLRPRHRPRLARGSRTVRGPRREVISRSYNLLLAAPCARSATPSAVQGDPRRRRRTSCSRSCEDDAWFFDTELLVLAERAGLRIHEVPVDWVDDPDSRVDIVRTALDDLRGIGRLGARPGHGTSAAARGGRPRGTHPDLAAPTGSSATRSPASSPSGCSRPRLTPCSTWRCGMPLPAFTANAAALLVTAVANTARKPPAHLRSARST